MRRFTETGQFRHATRLARLAQLLDRTNAQLLVERLDFSRAQAGNREQLQNGLRKFSAQIFEVFQRTGRGEFLNFQCDALPDPRNLRHCFFILKIWYVPAKSFDRARGVRVSPDLERIFALQLEQRCDLLENTGDFLLGHYLTVSADWFAVDAAVAASAPAREAHSR